MCTVQEFVLGDNDAPLFLAVQIDSHDAKTTEHHIQVDLENL